MALRQHFRWFLAVEHLTTYQALGPWATARGNSIRAIVVTRKVTALWQESPGLPSVVRYGQRAIPTKIPTCPPLTGARISLATVASMTTQVRTAGRLTGFGTSTAMWVAAEPDVRQRAA